jgi:hypothetical protein
VLSASPWDLMTTLKLKSYCYHSAVAPSINCSTVGPKRSMIFDNGLYLLYSYVEIVKIQSLWSCHIVSRIVQNI